jgi:hypothetical protein
MTDDIKEEYQKVRKMLRDGMIAKGIDPYGGYGETEPDDWQPIETAPKDGTRVLVYSNDKRQAVAYCDLINMGGFYDEPIRVWNVNGWLSGDTGFIPTHWMPLPEPPK